MILRIVSQPGVAWASSIRASDAVVIPALYASASRVRPRSSRSPRSAAARAGSGFGERGIFKKMAVACLRVHAFSGICLTTYSALHTIRDMPNSDMRTLTVELTAAEHRLLSELAAAGGIDIE